mmetsp:Transcript_107744/g.300284  ORF Transcript_107744/g.300284 Transcript_107744/m.300284 type:complete len:253 (+) Transcript_107744:57-815(+)
MPVLSSLRIARTISQHMAIPAPATCHCSEPRPWHTEPLEPGGQRAEARALVWFGLLHRVLLVVASPQGPEAISSDTLEVPAPAQHRAQGLHTGIAVALEEGVAVVAILELFAEPEAPAHPARREPRPANGFQACGLTVHQQPWTMILHLRNQVAEGGDDEGGAHDYQEIALGEVLLHQRAKALRQALAEENDVGLHEGAAPLRHLLPALLAAHHGSLHLLYRDRLAGVQAVCRGEVAMRGHDPLGGDTRELL